MKKEIIQIDKKKGIYRITTLNERWYAKEALNKETGLPEFQYLPSSTWVASYYYTSPYLIQWIASKGLDESERLKQAAGDKGSKVHYACNDIDMGKEINISDKYPNPTTGELEELKIEEIDCIQSYCNALKEFQPQILASELTGFTDISAGTIDKIWAIKNEVTNLRQIYIVDLKTGKSIYDEYKLQLGSYSHMDIDYKKLGITEEEWQNRKLAILQLGYILNKAGYKFTEIEDWWDEFSQVAYRVWQKMNPNAKPKEASYLLILKSPLIKVAEPAEPEKTKKVKKNESN